MRRVFVILYEEIANFQVDSEYDVTFEKIYPHLKFLQDSSTPVTISEDDRLTIKVFAEEIRFTLPEEFFYFGDLRKNRNAHVYYFGEFQDNDLRQLKYDKIISLIKHIKSYWELKPIDMAWIGRSYFHIL